MCRWPWMMVMLVSSLATAAELPEVVNTQANDPAVVLDAAAFPDEAWAKALKADDKAGAIKAFVHKLRTGPARSTINDDMPAVFKRWLNVEIGSGDGTRLADADEVIKKRYVVVYGIEHTFEGDIDWLYDASKKPGVEPTNQWTLTLSRHSQWVGLADAYTRTKDPKYARHWEYELRTWLAQCPRPAGDQQKAAEVWRSIDTGIRASWTWPFAFDVFRKSPDVSDEALWLMVCGWRQFAIHLNTEKRAGHNFGNMQTAGLGFAGLMFPEMRDSKAYVDRAMKWAGEILDDQFYPDGSHVELAPSYAAGTGFVQLYILAQEAQFRGREVPADFAGRLRATLDALIHIADPEGRTPPLHDSPAVDVKGLYADAAKLTGGPPAAMPPWKTTTPELRPWGGYVMLRRADRFGFFDAGPWGTSAHRHADCLQFIAMANGHWFLVDPGKPRYNQSATTWHMRTAAGHNVVLCDAVMHRELNAEEKATVAPPIALAEKDGIVVTAARRRMAALAPKGQVDAAKAFTHERIVVDLPGVGWLVVDRLVHDVAGEHEWEALWHVRADDVKLSKTLVATLKDGRSLEGHFVATHALRGELTAGQPGPNFRGWGPADGDAMPTPLPVARQIVKAAGPVAMASLFVPATVTKKVAVDGVAIATTGDDAMVTFTIDGAPRRVVISGSEAKSVRVETGATGIVLPLSAHSRQ